MIMTQGTTSNPYRVLAGLDFSALGDRAIVEAVRACVGHAQAELHVLVVASDEDGLLSLPGDKRLLTQEQADTVARDYLAKLLVANEALVHATKLEQVAVYVAPGSAAERIVSLAAAVDAELIVVGTHGRTGLSRLVLGSVAEEVVRTASCGVLVIRPRDFLNGEKLPEVAAPLKPGEHSLKPFAHGPTFHYVRRSPSSSMML
jgi:nucleotide-binding universal stress UspA family protein